MAKDKAKFKIPGIRSLKVNSCWIFHFDGSGCDGCNAEYIACLGPGWDIERLGFRNTGNPSYADILLVTGLLDEKARRELQEVYEQTKEGCKVVSAGACACTGGMVDGCADVLSGADSMIPVDLYAAGCAIRPEGIIDAIIKARDMINKNDSVTAEEAQENNEQENV